MSENLSTDPLAMSQIEMRVRGMSTAALIITLRALASDQELAVLSIAEDGSVLEFLKEAARRLENETCPTT